MMKIFALLALFAVALVDGKKHKPKPFKVNAVPVINVSSTRLVSAFPGSHAMRARAL